MTIKTPPLTDLAAAAEQARLEYEAAQAATEAAAAQAQERREAAHTEHDTARLEDYDDTALTNEVRAAEQRLREAVLADPVYRALIDLHAAGIRRYYRHTEATGDIARLGIDRRLPPVSPPASPSFETVLYAVELEASAIAADEQEARDAARVAAGDKAAGK